MSKSRFSDHECPVARGLDQIGDWWTLLVVREVMYGLEHFEAMRKSLGISRAVLSARLKRLIDDGILDKSEDAADGRAVRYRLTQKGYDLWPVMLAVLNWSNKHVLDADEDIVTPHDRRTGVELVRLGAVGADGRMVEVQDAVLRDGRDASRHFSRRIRNAFPPDEAAADT